MLISPTVSSYCSGSFDTCRRVEAGVATLNYGVFINTVIEFIIAFVLFMMVRPTTASAGSRKRRQPSRGTPRQEVLLEEIRDALRSPAN